MKKNFSITTLATIIIAIILQLTLKTSSIYADSCDVHSVSGWYPATYSYNTSTLNLFGQSSSCWINTTYYDKGYSQGAQYPGIPLDKIKVTVVGWEQADNTNCTSMYNGDSGWKYNTSSATAVNTTRSYQCTGTFSHYYLNYSTHYFGTSSQTTTGHK